ncbi:hypothetical protein GCM10008927_24710 [Amylibacter ulvae]|uniref:DUF304 domain-containing protein n=1 Tax=Paramylibacter ulvae TaxID=1651968 RepID=A0ABQ3D490_9RHOB|nr:hypothetical protein [Amylibacter ulvae]GHA57974.1 hypothetical protein GCM10008927_24710 [Amylibacter ulvae]
MSHNNHTEKQSNDTPTEIVSDMIDNAPIAPLSTAWPPKIDPQETIMFQGKFSSQAWVKNNVMLVYGVAAVCVILAMASDLIVDLKTVNLVIAALTVGTIVTFVLNRNQEWLITDRAVYVKQGHPVPLSSIRKIQGFGATVRFTGRAGSGRSLIGVENAADMRAKLTGKSS